MDKARAYEAGAMIAEINGKLTRYTKEFGRPSLIDWWLYDYITQIDLSEYIVVNSLDDILVDYLSDSFHPGFTIEFGPESLDESIMDYLVEKGHVKSIDDLEDEEEDEEDEDEDE
jgi:hypothetical protein